VGACYCFGGCFSVLYALNDRRVCVESACECIGGCISVC
jgi:hypothetical protein